MQEPDRIQHNQSTNGREEMQEYFVEEIELSNSNTLSSKTRKEVPQQSESETTRDFYEECWLDGEESSNKIIDIRLSANNLNNSSTNVPSKILGMSSDGAAIIEEKSSALHSKKKEKGKQVHVCDLCGNVYEKRYALQAHIRRHRDEKPFECE